MDTIPNQCGLLFFLLPSFNFVCSSSFCAELEATEACRWLRATGFPQYAQMYEGEPIESPAMISPCSIRL